ncbi:MAG: M50 family metallopeptidase [Chromatiaceae bacterium]|nr:M50 family metallopeptidase [Chromatiaceae bacterium]
MTPESERNWALIATLRPRLRKHIQISAQRYRGERWYLLRDESSGRFLRFNSTAYELIGRLDGQRQIADIVSLINAGEEQRRLTTDEVQLLLTQLSAIDALHGSLPADAKKLFERSRRERQQRLRRTFMNPLSIRIPLLDPDRILKRLLPWVNPLFTRAGAIIWLLVVLLAAVLTLTHFHTIGQAFDSDILAPLNLIWLLLVFWGIKTVHEFAHAFAVKRWGGEVHEMGITLLVLAPVPYVNATAAWGFREKYRRVLVSAVGILVELFIAAVSLFIWLAVEPGLVKDLARNAMLIGSVSTLLFNANPLLKFDGYHLLQDLIEIPNLSSRANRFYLYLVQRYLFGVAGARSPVTASGEVAWFVVYGFAAFCYRVLILVVIVLSLVEHYLFIGIILGLWAITLQLLLPIIRAVRYLITGPALAGRRIRAAAFSVLPLTALAAGLLFFPVALTTHAEGVVWVSDQARLYAGSDGFVSELLVEPGERLQPGMPVLRMQAPELATRVTVLEAKLRELTLRAAAERLSNRVASAIIREEIATVSAELTRLREQANSLLITSKTAGTLVLPEVQRLQGRYLRQGELVGYLVSPGGMIVRAVVPQDDIGLLRRQVERVELRLAEHLGEVVESSVVRQTPAGSTLLPSRALGAAGGGAIAVKPAEHGGLTAAEKVFQVDLTLPKEVPISGIGQRAYVRFEHGAEPLALQWIRSGRQLLLSRLAF